MPFTDQQILTLITDISNAIFKDREQTADLDTSQVSNLAKDAAVWADEHFPPLVSTIEQYTGKPEEVLPRLSAIVRLVLNSWVDFEIEAQDGSEDPK